MSANLARDKCTGPETLIPGALRGFRSWDLEIWSNPLVNGRADKDRIDFLGLFATSMSLPWTQPMTAQCYRTAGCSCSSCKAMASRHIPTHDPAEGDVPVFSCECGIYGWYHPGWIEKDHWWPKAGAVGVIEATGKVVMGPRGFRTQQARVVAVAPACTPEVLERSQIGVLGFLEAFDRIRPRLLDLGVKVFEEAHELFDTYPHEDVTSLVDVEYP